MNAPGDGQSVAALIDASLQTTGSTMSHHEPEAVVAPDLLTASSAAIGALAGAIDDLHRAGLILRQMASGASQRIRGPEDYRRIAGQFCDRARLCRAAEDALLAACRPAQASTAA